MVANQSTSASKLNFKLEDHFMGNVLINFLSNLSVSQLKVFGETLASEASAILASDSKEKKE